MLGLAVAVTVVLAFADGGYNTAQWAWVAIAFPALAALLTVGCGFRHQEPVGRLSVVVGLLATAGLVAWTAVAVVWSPNRGVSLEELARTCMYASALYLGWMASRSRGAVATALTAWVIAAATVALAELVRMDHDIETAFLTGRFLGSVGYHNGEAAFLLVPVAAGIAVAASRSLPTGVRAVAAGCTCVLMPVATLTQSRGALVALVVSLVVLVVLAPSRWRVVLAAVPSAATTLAAWPALSDAYTGIRADRIPVDRLHDVRSTALLGAALAMVAVLFLGLWEEWRPERSGWRSRFSTKSVAWATVGVVVLIGVGGIAGIGRFQSIWHDASDGHVRPGMSEDGGSRFVVGENDSVLGRVLLWKVATDIGRANPVVGVGPANFEAAFYRERPVMRDRYVRQPHNLILELWAERGIVGLALASVVLAACLWAAVRARIQSTSEFEATLIAGITASVAYWLVHAQFDWIWQISADTLGVMVLLGCLLGAPWGKSGESQSRSTVGWAARVPVAVGLLACAGIAVGPYVAARETRAAERLQVADPKRAADHLETARMWMPWSEPVAIMQADVYEDLGDRKAADSAIERSRRLDPEHWAPEAHAAIYFDRTGRPEAAKQAREEARRRNPLEPDVDEIR